MDVKNVFLNSDSFELVYMQPPYGVSAPPDHVCRLYRAIYRLKQVPRAWFEKFGQSFLSAIYTESFADYARFYRGSS